MTNSCKLFTSGGTSSSWSMAVTGMRMGASEWPSQESWLSFAQHACSLGLIFCQAGTSHRRQQGAGFVIMLSHWSDAASRFLYALFLTIDTNFHLKRKKVSSEEQDPSLNKGWGCFVEEKLYKEHLMKHWDQKQDVPEFCCLCSRGSNLFLFTSAATVSTIMLSKNLIKKHEALPPLVYWLLTAHITTSNSQMVLETFKWARDKLMLRFLSLHPLILTRYLNSDYVALKSLFTTAIMFIVFPMTSHVSGIRTFGKEWKFSPQRKPCQTTSSQSFSLFQSSTFPHM